MRYIKSNNMHGFYLHDSLESFRWATCVSQRIEGEWGGVGWGEHEVHVYIR